MRQVVLHGILRYAQLGGYLSVRAAFYGEEKHFVLLGR